MRVAYVSTTDPTVSKSGGALTVSGWLAELTSRGFEFHVVCRGTDRERRRIGDTTVTRLDAVWPAEELVGRLRRIDPDVVLVQSGWASIALEAAAEIGVPSVFSVTAVSASEELFARLDPTRFVANSEYTQQWIASTCGRDSTLVYPHIDFDFYEAGRDVDGTVSMLNPVREKGGETFRRLARLSPDREFLAKRGWYSLRADDGSWDRAAIAASERTFSTERSVTPDEVGTPTEIEFGDAPNVEFITVPDIRRFYRRSRVVLVPSRWRETFGRVVVEAMYNRIPVVASHRGGLPEACGGAGLLVEEYTNPVAWWRALRRLDDPDVYETVAERGRERARRYRETQSASIDRLAETIRAAASEG
ncbi:MAG: glycosyltransferase family 4 protein [Halobaculum sp.]